MPTGGAEGKSLKFHLTGLTPTLLQQPDLGSELSRIHQPLLSLGQLSSACNSIPPAALSESSKGPGVLIKGIRPDSGRF